VALSFNGSTKIVSITTDTELDVKDLWSRYVDWYLTSDNSKYGPAMSQVGGNDIDTVAGTSIPVYIYLENGWKVKPKEANHTLSVVNGILLTSDSSTPYQATTGSYNVVIRDQQPVQAIGVATGGGGGSSAADIWSYTLTGKTAAQRLIDTDDNAELSSIKP
jgi:hypothetical protein